MGETPFRNCYPEYTSRLYETVPNHYGPIGGKRHEVVVNASGRGMTVVRVEVDPLKPLEEQMDWIKAQVEEFEKRGLNK